MKISPFSILHDRKLENRVAIDRTSETSLPESQRIRVTTRPTLRFCIHDPKGEKLGAR